ncbi:hypothetical protein CC1G_12780 [Coprinopsis cinerea okayama7|uniref:Uncharacterized protein n=1 Tax=Coprinopsis cinerea (strain Okayama-7 / 130 / ATCC MYA-4618 / FGSC 9003) TaxID=240176 RepID=A8PHT2_COPC7|nr:hypothetical protein CC1G_12780 [Coprinopsis cinerea okayama7\|eukprot:XP_001841460.1 hypothetical protein CC1G_12780 [Coprinopsis cinerea okayama7\
MRLPTTRRSSQPTAPDSTTLGVPNTSPARSFLASHNYAIVPPASPLRSSSISRRLVQATMDAGVDRFLG